MTISSSSLTFAATPLSDLSPGDLTTYNYPGWKEDLKSIEDIMMKTMRDFGSSFIENEVRTWQRKMKNRQVLFDGTCRDPNILRLMDNVNTNEFTYPGFESDKNKMIDDFKDGLELNVACSMSVLEMKQRIFRDDSSHPLLQQLTRAETNFNYRGCEDDLIETKKYLFNLKTLSFDRERAARDKLSEMQKKQDMFDGKRENDVAKRIDLLDRYNFSYPNFEDDREFISEIDSKKSFQQALAVLKIRQAAYEGDRSNRVLKFLTKNRFSYLGWKNEREEVLNILLKGPPLYCFYTITAENKAWKKVKGMKNKQKNFKGIDIVTKIFSSNILNYPEFQNDKKDIMEDYFKGEDILDKINYVLLQQKVYNGDRSHPILSAIDRVVGREDEEPINSYLHSSSSCDENNRRSSNGKECVICMERSKSYAFVPCGHLALCEKCAQSPPYCYANKINGMKCPICRSESSMIMQVFGLQ